MVSLPNPHGKGGDHAALLRGNMPSRVMEGNMTRSARVGEHALGWGVGWVRYG